jgi:hypothetical protein
MATSILAEARLSFKNYAPTKPNYDTWKALFEFYNGAMLGFQQWDLTILLDDENNPHRLPLLRLIEDARIAAGTVGNWLTLKKA